MDVIALSEAGFRAAVAPLGTAVTEDQLRLMWRIHDAVSYTHLDVYKRQRMCGWVSLPLASRPVMPRSG